MISKLLIFCFILTTASSSAQVESDSSVIRISAYPNNQDTPYGSRITGLGRKVPTEEYQTPTVLRIARNATAASVDARQQPHKEHGYNQGSSVQRLGELDEAVANFIAAEPIGPPVPALQASPTTRRSLFGQVRPPSIRPPQLAGNPGLPPSFHGSPSAPSPPGIAFPPAPPIHSAGGSPPAPPTTARPPAPPHGSDETQVRDGFEAVPVFEERPTLDPTSNPSCRMIPTQLVGMFQLIASDFSTCGIRSCKHSSGEVWYCLLLRFPLITGLKLPEDEIIEIRCKPQDRKAEDIHILSVATAKYADKSAILSDKQPSVFEGGKQEFQCEIGLFRKLPGTTLFTQRVLADMTLELGEEVQLWSIVRGGDGWQYSRLAEIVVQRAGGEKARSALNTAVLVFNDGCRKPLYKLLAPNHPKRDSRNPLINRFTFRIFMFQDMELGDSLMISAKVIGCVEEEDCRPSVCPDDTQPGYGRKKREVGEYTFSTTVPTSSLFSSLFDNPGYSEPVHSNTTFWSRNLAVKVKLPETVLPEDSVLKSECHLYLFITLGVAAVFFIVSIVFTVWSVKKKKQKCVKKTSVASSKLSRSFYWGSTKGSESGSTSDTSADTPVLQNYSIPPTVRQRKKEVHAELLSAFQGDKGFPYGSYYPGMFNYYGYMVVPRRPQENDQKRSLRTIKAEHRRRSKQENNSNVGCSCHSSETPSEDENLSNKEHKSVIHIPGDTVSTEELKSRPRSYPRRLHEENPYSEIKQDLTPTMV